MTDHLHTVPASELRPHAAPRCEVCGTAYWWMGGRTGWRHADAVTEIDPVAAAQRYAPDGLPDPVRVDLLDRDWLEAPAVLPYRSSSEAVRLFVLEGSPPRGFVLAWRDRAVRLGPDGEHLLEMRRHIVPTVDCPRGREELEGAEEQRRTTS